jgi:hypothetical protein
MTVNFKWFEKEVIIKPVKEPETGVTIRWL